MLKRLAGALAAGVGMTAVAMTAAPTAAYAQTANYNIPAGSLRQALDAYARQSGRQVIYRSDDVRGARSRGARGAFSAEAALQAILSDSGFTSRADPSGAVAIVRSGEADAGSTAAEDEGAEIVVTGTYLRHANRVSPVIVASREQISREGFARLDQYLDSLPQNFRGASEEYSGTTASQSAQARANGVSGAAPDLRGLGTGATLVLFDGQRVETGGASFLDISLIPLVAVERIEVLTDGASAVYGSDAVAGVVNIIPRRGFSGVDASFRQSVARNGSKSDTLLNLAAGVDWRTGNITGALFYSDVDALQASDRSFSSGADPRQTLVPAQETYGGFATVRQALFSGWEARGTGLWSTRRFDAFSALSNQRNRGETQRLVAIGSIAGEIGEWRLQATGSYSRADSDTTIVIGTRNPIRSQNVSEAYNARVIFDGAVFELPAGPVQLALGAEYQDDDFRSIGTARRYERTNRSFFGEISIPLFSEQNRLPLLRELTFNGSVRTDRYSDFGSTTNGRVGVVWSPAARLQLSGTFSTAFRAPPFTSLITAGNLSAIVNTTVDPQSPTGSSLAIRLQGANPDVGPETSRSLTLGARWSLGNEGRFAVSINYFDIDYEDRLEFLLLSTGANFLNVESQFSEFIIRNPTQAQISAALAIPGITINNTGGFDPNAAVALADLRWQNTSSSRIRGIDASVQSRLPLWSGEIRMSFDATYVIDYTSRITENSTEVERVDRLYFPVDWKIRAAAQYQLENAGIYARVNHQDAYWDFLNTGCALPASGCVVSAWTTLDLGARVTFDLNGPARGQLSFGLDVRNVFDSDPPFVADSNRIGFDPSHADPLGRVISVTGRVTW